MKSVKSFIFCIQQKILLNISNIQILVLYQYIKYSELKTVCFFSQFIQTRDLFPQLTLSQLIQLDLESWNIVRCHLGPSIQSGSSPCAGLQMVMQSSYLWKDCYPQLVLNPYNSKIPPPKQPDYRCMPLNPDQSYNTK